MDLRKTVKLDKEFILAKSGNLNTFTSRSTKRSRTKHDLQDKSCGNYLMQSIKYGPRIFTRTLHEVQELKFIRWGVKNYVAQYLKQSQIADDRSTHIISTLGKWPYWKWYGTSWSDFAGKTNGELTDPVAIKLTKFTDKGKSFDYSGQHIRTQIVSYSMLLLLSAPSRWSHQNKEHELHMEDWGS